jgi:hypothetical protein
VNQGAILVFGEGRHELGPELDNPVGPDNLHPLPCLIHRLINTPPDARYIPTRFASVPHVGGKGRLHGKLARKVNRAVLQAKAKGCAGVVILIDQDRDRKTNRLEALRQGRESLAGNPIYPPCAVGTAIETFEAWMIADPEAIKKAGGDPSKAPPNPEAHRTPKAAADRVFQTSGGSGLGERYRVVALQADIGTLERRCPGGFKPFAEEVRERIGHVFQGRRS